MTTTSQQADTMLDDGADPVAASDLLARLARDPAATVELEPMVKVRRLMDGANDVVIGASVAVHIGDAPAVNIDLRSLLLAADCLAEDPPFTADPELAPRLRGAVTDAARSVAVISRSIR